MSTKYRLSFNNLVKFAALTYPPIRRPDSSFLPLAPPFPPATVIPAKAGIHTPACRYAETPPGFWIPAYAGMTVGDGVDRWIGRCGMTPAGEVNDRIVEQAAGPLPAGEGWVREKRCTPPTPVFAGDFGCRLAAE